MNSRTESLLAQYEPKIAIVVYGADDRFTDAYIESHEINERGQLLEGKPLKQETIQAMVDVFFDERKNPSSFKGIFPDNLLLFELLPGGNHKMIWWRSEERRQLFFADQLHIKSGTAWVPSLMYMVDDGGLSVFALQTKARPDSNTNLFRAPFHNVSSDGSVCLGNAKVAKPEKTYAAVMKYWEDMFWLSEFSHLAGQENPTKSNLSLLWNQLIGTDAKWSIEELLMQEKTLKNYL